MGKAIRTIRTVCIVTLVLESIQGWCQGAGDGSFFAVHTETIDGKKVKVLVQAGGATIATDAVYYQTQSLAHQNKDTEFDDLHYADDD